MVDTSNVGFIQDLPQGKIAPSRQLPPPAALQRDDWLGRHVVLFVTYVSFLGMLVYIVLTAQSNAVDQLAVPSLIAGIVTLTGVYVFGQVWDYRSFMNSIADMHNTEATA